jgi:hypothetical protein
VPTENSYHVRVRLDAGKGEVYAYLYNKMRTQLATTIVTRMLQIPAVQIPAAQIPAAQIPAAQIPTTEPSQLHTVQVIPAMPIVSEYVAHRDLDICFDPMPSYEKNRINSIRCAELCSGIFFNIGLCLLDQDEQVVGENYNLGCYKMSVSFDDGHLEVECIPDSCTPCTRLRIIDGKRLQVSLSVYSDMSSSRPRNLTTSPMLHNQQLLANEYTNCMGTVCNDDTAANSANSASEITVRRVVVMTKKHIILHKISFRVPEAVVVRETQIIRNMMF